MQTELGRSCFILLKTLDVAYNKKIYIPSWKSTPTLIRQVVLEGSPNWE